MQNDSIKTQSNNKEHPLTQYTCLFLLLLCSFVITLIGSIFQWQGLFIQRLTLEGFFYFILNWLPVLGLMLFLFFLSNKLIPSISAAGLFYLTLFVINLNKLSLRNEPFMPYDLLVIFEFGGIAKSMGIFFYLKLIVGLGAFILLSVFLSKRIKAAKMSFKYRTCCLVVSLVLGAILYASLYSGSSDYRKGFLYSFLCALNEKSPQEPSISKKAFEEALEHLKTEAKPEANSANAKVEVSANADAKISANAEAEISAKAKEQNTASPNSQKSHLILIMSESFSELFLNPAFDLEGFENPYSNYLKIKEEAISGNLFVPQTGGGTADTEFEVLTGLSSKYLSPNTYGQLKKPLPSIISTLKAQGYYAEAIHPGYSWFYGRKEAYQTLGFEKFEALEAFSNSESKGGYISETATIQKILNNFERHIDTSDQPYLSFTVTIQNHGPYEGKYKSFQDEDFFRSKVKLSKAEENALKNYYYGLLDCDKELGKLVAYFKELEEPVTLLYFGDHLPPLKGDFYQKLETGASSDYKPLRYTVPYLIWQNSTAKETCPLIPIEPHQDFSAFYLGGTLLDLLGLETSALMNYTNQLRLNYPRLPYDFTLIQEEDGDKIGFFRDWCYYSVY